MGGDGSAGRNRTEILQPDDLDHEIVCPDCPAGDKSSASAIPVQGIQGRQSVRTLLRQNRGVSSVEISKTGIRGLERYAKKYGIDYAIRKDTSEVPPRYLVFFKAPMQKHFNQRSRSIRHLC